MIIRLISDINPKDPMVVEIERICYALGIMNMSDVWLIVEELREFNGNRIAMEVNKDSAWEVTRNLMAMVAYCLAGVVHEEFQIETLANTPINEKASMSLVTINRKFSVDVLERSVNQYLAATVKVMDRFPEAYYFLK